MTLDQLRYFMETARFQHLNKAARSLNISPSAVSSAIAALEEEFKCKLFTREGKGIRLTDKGQFLKTQSEVLFEQANTIRLRLAGDNAEFFGTYKIAASHFLATHMAAPLWPSLARRFPNLSVELGSMATHQVIADVISGSVDAGLCMGPLRHPDLNIFEINQGQMFLAARTSHPVFKLPVSQQLKAISQYPALIHKPMIGVDVCDNHPMFKRFGINPKIRCFWDSDDLAIQIIKASDSWTMLPDFVIRMHPRILRSLPAPTGWNAPNTVSLIVRSASGKNSFAEILVTEISKAF